MPSSNLTLATEVKYLKGVGPFRAELLAGRGIYTVEDLLYYTPFRYEDRTHFSAVRDLVPGQMATILVRVLTGGLMRTRNGTYIYDLSAVDVSEEIVGGSQKATGSGSLPTKVPVFGRPGARNIIRCKWFNSVYLEKNKVFKSGQRVFFYGKVEHDQFGNGNLQMIQPQFEILHEEPAPGGRGTEGNGQSSAGNGQEPEGAEGRTAEGANSLELGRIVPIYQAIGAIGSRVMRRLVWTALETLGDQIPECLPECVLRKNKLTHRAASVLQTHFPDKPEMSRTEDLCRFRTPAQIRLIFEELFNVGAGLALKRRKQKLSEGIAFELKASAREAIKRILPFHPTAAQKRVLGDIVADMALPHPMNRLLQGDVGSGKTIVAIQAAIVALENGYQVALMAPTEILATQHYLYMKRLLSPLPYTVDLLVSARKSNEKAELKQRIAEGSANIVVGTHALVEGDVEFARLGLVIVDEQHRFGVIQRYKLMKKGPNPDVLVMTATPIPRTLALTLYADLDFSVIDELPPNRTPVRTELLAEGQRSRAFELIRSKVKAGEQAYVVYPLVEESDKLELRAAVEMYEQLSRNVFPELKLGLLHGRLPSEEKEQVMQAFKAGEVQVLVATTVVEVGVDVPNATVMLIEHADRFGLAPLHQLRGRIGRGKGKSTCLLLADDRRTEVAEERLRTMVETTDGFKIAEIDLKLRGPGEFFGTQQAGIPAFRIANLIRDREIQEWAKKEAADFVDHPPSPKALEDFARTLRSSWPRRYGLARVG